MSHQDTEKIDIQSWLDRQQVSQRTIDLSIVVPAYNEQWRIPSTLIDLLDYLDDSSLSYEVIVVDDGSSDGTSDVVKKFEKIRTQIRHIRIPVNYGKGHAVKTGILNSYGNRVLFTDADGATPIKELERLMAALDKGVDVAIGSRALASEDTQVTTNFMRKYLGRIFNAFINLFLLKEVSDTQCGFKLFTAPAALYLFETQRSKGFSFDFEILFIANRVGMKVSEVPVNWQNVPGSKVNVVIDGLKMFIDIFVFRFRHRGLSTDSFKMFLEKIKNSPK